MEFSQPYIYILAFYTLLFFIELFNIRHLLSRKVIRIVCAATFFSFFGFRGYVGTDWFNYEISYDLTTWNTWLLSDYEPGYSIVAKACKYFGLNYFTFVAVITLIQTWLFDKFINRYSPSISLCYIIVIALFPILIIDLLRNFTSILLVVNGLHFLESNNKKKFYLFVILGMLFHLSAIIFFIMPFMRKRIFKKWMLLLLLVFGFVVYFFQINFYHQILTVIGSTIGGGIQDLIMQSVNDGEVSYGISIGVIEKIALFIFLISIHSKLKNYSPLIVNACFIYILIYLYFSTSQTFINRFATLFFWGYMLTYVHVAVNMIIKKKGYFAFILLLFCFARTSLSYNNSLYYYANTLIHEENRENRVSNRASHYKYR